MDNLRPHATGFGQTAFRVHFSQECILAELRRIPVPGCGDCQFDAINYGAELPMTAADLRAEVVSYLRLLGDRYPARLEERLNGQWPSYCEHMSRPGSWGDELTFSGASHVLRRPIHSITVQARTPKKRLNK